MPALPPSLPPVECSLVNSGDAKMSYTQLYSKGVHDLLAGIDIAKESV